MRQDVEELVETFMNKYNFELNPHEIIELRKIKDMPTDSDSLSYWFKDGDILRLNGIFRYYSSEGFKIKGNYASLAEKSLTIVSGFLDPAFIVDESRGDAICFDIETYSSTHMSELIIPMVKEEDGRLVRIHDSLYLENPYFVVRTSSKFPFCYSLIHAERRVLYCLNTVAFGGDTLLN